MDLTLGTRSRILIKLGATEKRISVLAYESLCDQVDLCIKITSFVAFLVPLGQVVLY